MIKVEIDSIRVSLMSQDRVVVLKDPSSKRYLPIWIGPFEAEAIRVELQEIEMTRPLTHDLLKSVIVQLGGDLEYVIISELKNDTYYAGLRVKIDGKAIDVDSRPSDAMALAVRLKVPIFVDESVLEKAAITPEPEITSDPDQIIEARGVYKDAPSEEADVADLGAFSDFLESLDLDDLDDK